MEKETKIKEKSNIFLRVGAIILVVAVLFVISFAIVNVVPKALSSLASANLSFSSIFASKPALTASVSSGLIKSGDQTTINFSKTGTSTPGYYSLSYSCQNGAKLNYISGSSSVAINCAAPYPISPSGNSIVITGSAPANSTLVTVPITLAFTPNGAATSTLQTSLSLTISNTGTSTATISNVATSTQSVTQTVTSSNTTYTASSATGRAELSINLVDVGIIDPTSGQFISTRNFNAGNTVVVKFQIKNVGTKSTGAWSFNTSEPMTNSADSYRSSGTLASLLPGYSTGVITLALSGINPNGGTVNITTNPENKILSVVIPAANYAYNYNSNYSNGVYNGNTDLAVKIISLTDLNQYNNQYGQYYNYSPYSFHAGDTLRATVQVSNLGANPTGPYSIIANLNGVSQSFTNLQSIAPNSSTSLTITFTSVTAQGTGSLTITGQPQNGYDGNPANNTSSLAVYIY